VHDYLEDVSKVEMTLKAYSNSDEDFIHQVLEMMFLFDS
jgi:hypothetical protein